MSDGNDTPNQPSHIAYQVNEGKDGKAHFHRVGAAFEHKDREGFTVKLDSLPLDGRVTLRSAKDRLQQLKEGKNEQARDKDYGR